LPLSRLFNAGIISLVIVSRIIQTGHGRSRQCMNSPSLLPGHHPGGVIFRWRYHTGAILNIGLIVALLLLFLPECNTQTTPLYRFTAKHSAIGSCRVGGRGLWYAYHRFWAAIMYLVQNKRKSIWLPDATVLDTISYHSYWSVSPFLTLVIILGALWQTSPGSTELGPKRPPVCHLADLCGLYARRSSGDAALNPRYC